MNQQKSTKTTKAFKAFFDSKKSGGLILIGCTLISLVLANSVFGTTYLHFWHTNFAGQSIEYWIN
ncbi:MAG: Na+/H+ antiporter NhaA, partial [Flavobacterium sp.]|nr:Na+/H+ antiporter NhaA [Flavobacterium sp.]